MVYRNGVKSHETTKMTCPYDTVGWWVIAVYWTYFVR